MGPVPTFGIVLIKKQDNSAVVGLLQPVQDVDYLYHREVKHIARCLWYGKDWFMKADLGQASWPGNQNHLYWPGSLHLDETGWIATFSPSPSDTHLSELMFNLNTNTVTQTTNKAAPFLKWSIWESRELFEAGQQPLISVKATALSG
jgi:hypothetical protein